MIKTKYLFLYLIISMLISCISKDNKKINKVDSERLVTVSLNYILKNKKLAKEFYDEPLQIIKSNKLPINSKIVVNNKACVLLPENTNINKILKTMDLFKPKPIVEITGFRFEGNLIKLDLIFRTIGRSFKLEVNARENTNYQVINLVDSDI